jgi:hypothetical protein
MVIWGGSDVSLMLISATRGRGKLTIEAPVHANQRKRGKADKRSGRAAFAYVTSGRSDSLCFVRLWWSCPGSVHEEPEWTSLEVRINRIQIEQVRSRLNFVGGGKRGIGMSLRVTEGSIVLAAHAPVHDHTPLESLPRRILQMVTVLLVLGRRTPARAFTTRRRV